MSSKINIFYITRQSFPYGMAEVNKMILTSKSIGLSNEFNVKILIKYANSKKNNLAYKGCYDGVDYEFLSGISYRPNNFILRNLFKIRGGLKEFKYLFNADLIILNSKSILQILIYKLLSNILSFKIINTFHELESAIPQRNFIKKGNDYFFEKFTPKLIHGALPISYYIDQKIRKQAPNLKSYVLPSLVNLNEFSEVDKTEKYGDFFMYCCAASYYKAIEHIINAFFELKNKDKKLLIITNGTKVQMNKIQNLIALKKCEDTVIIKSGIDYKELISLYKSSLCNIITLFDNERDKSRFPHKIGEYCASSRPFITSATPDINRYFEDGKNALITKNYLTEGFTKKMQFVLNSSTQHLDTIGLNAHETSVKFFDYQSRNKELNDFLNSIYETIQ
jgi:glycosyltransferase involved in cell wall biosynthesis